MLSLDAGRRAQASALSWEASLANYSIERRNRPRTDASCLVQVRRPDVLANFGKLCAAQNSSLDSLYFVAEKQIVRQSMRLLLSFRPSLGGLADQRECLVEVVRTDERFQGQVGIAARLVDNLRLRFRLLDGLIVPESGLWAPSHPHLEGRFLNLYA